MVLGVCRRVLGDRHEAEDAFQATFLVLARKAAAIARREQLANWLYGVACRTALDARTAPRAARHENERAHGDVSVPEIKPADDDQSVLDELRAILDEELARLPERYRGAVVLCELDGLSRRAAAQRLGIPEGTLSSRLARAKDLLRTAWCTRGWPFRPSPWTGARPRGRGPHAIVSRLARRFHDPAATRVAAGASLAEVASTSVATLTQGVLKAMLVAKFKGIVLGLAAAAVVTTGVGVLAQPQSNPVPLGRMAIGFSALERKLDRILEALGGSRIRHSEAGNESVPG